MATMIPLPEDLELAVLAGSLSLAEAGLIVDKRLMSPHSPYSQEMLLLLAKVALAKLPQESVTAH